MMAGLILGALAGAGEAAGKTLQMQQMSDLETEKAITVAQAASDIKQQAEADDRANRAGVINQAIADAQNAKTLNAYNQNFYQANDDNSDPGEAKGLPFTADALPDESDPEVQAVKNGSALTPEERNSAALSGLMGSGWVSPESAASLYQGDARREMQTALNANRYDSLIQVANIKGDFAMQIAALKGAAAGNDKVMAHAVFQSGEQAIRDNNTQIAQLDREISTASTTLQNTAKADQASVKASIAVLVAQRDDLRSRIPALQDRQAEIAKQFGFKLPSIPKPAAHASPGGPGPQPADLPPGSVQIGTSGGKPVYQRPDGSRVISQ